jgi:hypothetical protein
MSLLQEIRDAAVDGSVPLATMLRKCAVLATKLGNSELRTWVGYELNGYPEDVDLPNYRTQPAPAVGHLAGPFGSGYRNISIPAAVMPEGFEKFATEVYLRQPIAAIEALVTGSNESGELSCPWPGNLIGLVQQKGKFASSLVLYGAWQSLSRAQLVALLDTVRNRVLDFVLQLEQDAPDAGDAPTPIAASSKATQQFINVIYGNVGNIASSNHSVVQTTTQVVQGDVNSLSVALREVGVPDVEVKELTAVLKAEESLPGMGPKTSAWISKATQALASGAWKVGTGVTAAVVVKMVLTFLGLG